MTPGRAKQIAILTSPETIAKKRIAIAALSKLGKWPPAGFAQLHTPEALRNKKAALEAKKRSLKDRFLSKIRRAEDCWEWLGAKDQRGYGKMYFLNQGKKTTKRAHRIAWEVFVGTEIGGLNICHHCDNPSCVRPDHLFLGTQKENLDDMRRKGRHLRKQIK